MRRARDRRSEAGRCRPLTDSEGPGLGLDLGPRMKVDPGLPHLEEVGERTRRRSGACPELPAGPLPWQTLKRAQSSGGGTRRSEACPRGPSEREVRDLRSEPPI
ncbi:hypothetical protein NDU88_007541 [Pleurodeles waltl]|uniref:Uncharacterized protein n=1 Tax=Pleurodeles waltl TaxID=8319 RepID=A0AAV7N3R3_PLEWA|nr:hypothetical protein NDU88_007541 [Pleurodeles waltl]